ncbi:hypothetical protein FKP32DRAFT_1345008 [Trametes sanguinea]|nr:hypothetical protein FKP32DRAFT_1345008 [Trametes sanguinea]
MSHWRVGTARYSIRVLEGPSPALLLCTARRGAPGALRREVVTCMTRSRRSALQAAAPRTVRQACTQAQEAQGREEEQEGKGRDGEKPAVIELRRTLPSASHFPLAATPIARSASHGASKCPPTPPAPASLSLSLSSTRAQHRSPKTDPAASQPASLPHSVSACAIAWARGPGGAEDNTISTVSDDCSTLTGRIARSRSCGGFAAF